MKREKRDSSRTFKKGVGRIQKGAGFTLIELMVVVVIIGILAAVALPRFMVNQRKAKEASAWADLDSMTTAMEMYYLDNDNYPTGTSAATYGVADGFDALIGNVDTETNWAGPYMKFRRDSDGDNIPEDPWGNEYQYEVDDVTAQAASEYTIWSKGGNYDSVLYSASYINSGWFASP